MPKLGILGGTFNPVHLGHLLVAETALDQLKLDRVIWVPSRQPPHRSPLDLVELSHRVEMVRQAIATQPAFDLSLVDYSAPLDVNRPTPSYAVDTLTALQHQYPHSQWYWILGLDAFQSLPRWYRRHDLIRQCYWLIVPRLHRSASISSASISSASISSAAATTGVPELDEHIAPDERMRDERIRDEHLKSDGYLWVRACEAVVEELRCQDLEVEWSLLSMPLVEISSSLIRRYRGECRSIRYLVPDAVWNYITAHNLYG